MNSPILKALFIGLLVGIAVWAATHRRPTGPEVNKLRKTLKTAQQANDSLREQLQRQSQLLQAKDDTSSPLRGSHNRLN